jgi:hypothetical protein
MSRCSSCNNWDSHHDASPPRTGDCRRYPPTIVNALVEIHMTTSTSSGDAVEMASSWPITGAGDCCGEWDGLVPC